MAGAAGSAGTQLGDTGEENPAELTNCSDLHKQDGDHRLDICSDSLREPARRIQEVCMASSPDRDTVHTSPTYLETEMEVIGLAYSASGT